MIATLHGLLFEKTPESIIVECGGVGYEALIPLSTHGELPKVGAECRVFVRHVVREDDELLFAFASRDERAVFDLLVAVSGVGPKIAIAVLSGMSTNEFKRCVAEGDVKRISSVKGVGKKTAERIVVELRGQIDPVEAMAVRAPVGKASDEAVLHDTVLALVQLGFPQDVAAKKVQAALDRGASATNANELLRRALAEK